MAKKRTRYNIDDDEENREWLHKTLLPDARERSRQHVTRLLTPTADELEEESESDESET